MFGLVIKGQLPSIPREKSSVLAVALRGFQVATYIRSKDDQNSGNGSKDTKLDGETKTHNKANVKEKLNDLLKLMMKDAPLVNVKEGIQLAKPKRIEKPKPAKTVKRGVVTSEAIDQKLVEATKDVAESIGGDVKETESELLQKLLSPKGSSNLSDLLGGMKIDRGDETKSRKEVSKDWSQVRREDAQMRRPFRRPDQGMKKERFIRGEQVPIDLLGGSRLGIFGKELDKGITVPAPLQIWEVQEARETRLATAHPPRNYYQQMILWTEQEKIWKFPIDNEQGLEEEKKVFFTEHVFLEPHLDPWCPKKGPIRHFMELVCVGLSKNPYMTVQQKKDTIKWYADYFDAKKDILKEVGALQ